MQHVTFYRDRSTVLPRRFIQMQWVVTLACGHRAAHNDDVKVFQHDPAWCGLCRKLTMVVR